MRYNLLASLFKEASFPVITTESSDWERSMNDAANIIRTKQSISQIRDAEKATGFIQYGLESIRDQLKSLNEQGGLNRSQFDLAQLAVESHCQRLEIPMVFFGIEATSFNKDAPVHPVSLEELDEVIELVDGNHAALADDARDACSDFCDTAKSAIPNAAARLFECVSNAEKSDTVGGAVTDQSVIDCFMNGEDFPENFDNFILSYCILGKKLMGPYLKDAASAVATAVEFAQVPMGDAEAFSHGVEAIFSKIKDPRDCLNEADMSNCLPGEGPLFADEEHECDVGDSHDKLICHCAPQDPGDYHPEFKNVPTSIPALTKEQIVMLGGKLHELAMECDVAQFESDCEAFSKSLDVACEAFAKAFANATDEVAGACQSQAEDVNDYLETLKKLAYCVPVDFMTNLLQTLNAFINYVQLSQCNDSGLEALSGDEPGTDAAIPKNIELDANAVSDLSGQGKEDHPDMNLDAGEPKKPQDGGAPEGAGVGSAPLKEGEVVTGAQELSGDEVGPEAPIPANIDLDANKVSNLSGEGKPDEPDMKLEAGEPTKDQDGGAPVATDGEKSVEEKPALSGNEKGPDAPAPANIELDANKVSDLSGVAKDEHPAMEAGGVKLRSGMKVKYSHGYGKIVKIFDRPTKYKGEIHHATRDNPKYEVRSDDGKHLSLHKASALTAV